MSKQIIEVEAAGRWTKGVQTEVSIRHFEPFLIDEPKALGGHDEGANPIEYVLAGLNGCVSVMIAIIAKELDFSYDEVEFESSGTLDLQGLMGVEGVTPNFQTVTLNVYFDTEESAERVQELKEVVESRCPVMTLIRTSGVAVSGEWSKVSEKAVQTS